jgi:hypothetical protein
MGMELCIALHSNNLCREFEEFIKNFRKNFQK